MTANYIITASKKDNVIDFSTQNWFFQKNGPALFREATDRDTTEDLILSPDFRHHPARDRTRNSKSDRAEILPRHSCHRVDGLRPEQRRLTN